MKRIAKATGSLTPKSVNGTIPVKTNVTTIYNNVEITMEPIIPFGISFFGFFTSSAAMLTASNPRKAKKTKAAPLKTPEKP